MQASSSAFVFATCSPASSAWLKAEILEGHPEFRLAFSRPGVVTWKVPPTAELPLALDTPLARVSGTSLGRADSPESLATLLETHSVPAPLHLHVFELDASPREHFEQSPREQGERARLVEGALRSELGAIFRSGRIVPGDDVLDVMVRSSTEPDEPWLVGWHRQRRDRPTTPGCVQPVIVPPHSPSRSYAKLVEMLAFGELDPEPGSHAVEIGAAPGGASLALLERGLFVTGVDPAEMAPFVLSYVGPAGNRLRHLRMPAGAVKRDDLPQQVSLLLLDANLAPPVALKYLERVSALLRSPPRAAVIHLKMNDTKMQQACRSLIGRCVSIGQRWGLTEARAAQLPSHRREIGVVLTAPKS